MHHTPPAAVSDTTRIGWVGCGVMGRSLCRHLLDAGYSLAIYSRTRSKVRDLEQAGAQWQDSPAEVGRVAEIAFTMVGYPRDVQEVILGEQGLLQTLKPGSVLVDMTTSEPALAKRIEQAAQDRQVHAVDAPVSGGDIGARNATLSIMIGGDEATVGSLQPLWEILGATIVHQGPAGSGQHAKMVNQILIATNMIGLCEALLYAQRSGLDPKTVMQSVGGGAAGSWSLNNLGPRILANDFAPGFYVDHFLKDLKIALQEAERLQLALPGLALARQLYLAVQAQGGSQLGTQALQLALARLSNIDWQQR